MPCRQHDPISIPGCYRCERAAQSRENRKQFARDIAKENERLRQQAAADAEPSVWSKLREQAKEKEAAQNARKEQARQAREAERAQKEAERQAFLATPAGQEQLAREKAERDRRSAENEAEAKRRTAKQEAYRENYVQGLGQRRKATEAEAKQAGLEAAVVTFILLMIALFGSGQQLHWWVGLASIAGLVTIMRRYYLGGNEHGKETRVYEVVAKALFIPVVLLGGFTIPTGAGIGWMNTTLIVGSLIFCGYAFVAGQKAYRNMPLKLDNPPGHKRVLFPWL